MRVYPTVEVRWFYTGLIPAEVSTWFDRGERPPDDQPCRVDRYFRLGGMHSLGVKLRDGRLELKQRQRSYGIVLFHERISGLVESWRKWSFEIAADGDNLENLLEPDSSWIAIQKQRRLRRFRRTQAGETVAHPADEYPAQGCSLELTSIMVGGKPWWSLGLESFGDNDRLQENLFAAIQHVLAQKPVPTLAANDSYGYPTWLAALVCVD